MIRPAELIEYARHEITPGDEAAVLGVLRSRWLTQGPRVEEFEAALASLCDAKYAVCVNSGASALYLAFGCLSATDLVTTPITFAATINIPQTPSDRYQFLDVEAETGRWAAWYPPLTPGGVSLPVTIGGVPFDGRSPGTYGRTLVDATHSLGAVYPGHALAACFSFHPAKHICAGEGGAVVTNHALIADMVRAMANHARSGTTRLRGGFNMRMDEMSGALGLSQLGRLGSNIARRRWIAREYDEVFRDRVDTVAHPPESVYHLYQILVDPTRRDVIQKALHEAKVGTAIHYPALAPYPNALTFAASTLSIPMFPSLTDAEVEYVAATVKRVVEECQ